VFLSGRRFGALEMEMPGPDKIALTQLKVMLPGN
jgi:hypothetical protein